MSSDRYYCLCFTFEIEMACYTVKPQFLCYTEHHNQCPSPKVWYRFFLFTGIEMVQG